MKASFPQSGPKGPYRHFLPASAVPDGTDVLRLPSADEIEFKPSHFFHRAVTVFDDRNSNGDDYRGNSVPKDPRPSLGFVYAAAYEGSQSFVKVGESRFFPTRRLSDLTTRTAAPSELKLLFALETPFRRATEGAAHETLRLKHSKGEWFRLGSDDLLAVMTGLAAVHEWRGYSWRLWTTPTFLGMCSAKAVCTLCSAGMGANIPANDPMIAAPDHDAEAA
jgi:hypothetical protein